MTDYYQTLGIKRGATADEVKSAYRARARESHPDRHPGDEKAEATFKEVGNAYEVLGDAEKRRMYDRGYDPLQRLSRPPNRPTNMRTDFQQRTIPPQFIMQMHAREAVYRLRRGALGITIQDKMDYAVKNGKGYLAVAVLIYTTVVPAQETLRFLVKKKDADGAEFFISKGTKPTPEMLAIATHNHDVKMVNLLLKAGVKPDQKMLDDAVRQGWSSATRAFISKGTAPTQKMLRRAKRNKDEAIVDILQKALATTEKPAARHRFFSRRQPTPA